MLCMAAKLLHYGLHLLSNTSIIITTLRRLDGKQCDSLMLFKLFPEVFGNSRKAKTKSIHCSRKIAPLIVQNWSVVWCELGESIAIGFEPVRTTQSEGTVGNSFCVQCRMAKSARKLELTLANSGQLWKVPDGLCKPVASVVGWLKAREIHR